MAIRPLDTNTLADIVSTLESRPIVSLRKDVSLKEALLILANNHILSAPVYDPSTNSCIGLIDVLDCATFTTQTYFDNSDHSQFKNYLLQFSFDVEQVGSVINMSGKNPYIPMKTTDSLMQLLKEFSNGVHRIPIMDENNNVIAVCSQMTLFQYLFKNIDLKDNAQLFTDFKKQTLKQVLANRTSTQKVINVKESQLAIDAIKVISDNGLSAVGVLSEKDGKLIGCLSASDLQGFIDEDYHHLASPVLEFQRKSREKNGSSVSSLVFCKIETHTVGDVIQRLLQDRVHRLFVMNDDMEVIALLSLTDIFKMVYEYLNAKQN
ncbi:hypothetical protein C9374_003899 [Naegleria lovaniensis]|uniref:CBS domain-containing protein n=1 Tax=Naegleria lovaniensis TaxID=51637 RepID=A0AA88KYL5_NAELO|nr:uncharacterized protein C9374_003899 [Naegleria lovaniensis]KAG2394135.1 hypothetical protein C9374_003899 [Naegleria lovaniensis]